jgi:hypothetical protein
VKKRLGLAFATRVPVAKLPRRWPSTCVPFTIFWNCCTSAVIFLSGAENLSTISAAIRSVSV